MRHSIACAAVAIGGLLYSFFAPPHYLGSAGSHLSKTDIPAGEANLLMHKIGGHLGDAGVYQYISIFSYLLGGVITACSVSSSDDSGVLMGGCFLGLGVICDLLSAIRISCTGMGLDKASRMQLD